MAQTKNKSKKASNQTPEKEKGTKVASDALPRRTLEDALRVAQIIRDTYSRGSATWSEIAQAMGVSEKNDPNRYPLWAATAYGIVLKVEDNTYSLGETGRKILAPTYDSEKDEGIKKALFTPSVLSRFYTAYNGSAIPGPDLLPNVLETRYGVPRGRTAEAIKILIENARYAKALVKRDDGKEGLEFTDAAFPVTKPREADLSTHDIGGADAEATPDDQGASANGDWDKICFVITPIGNDDSEERKHSDTILKHLLEPVLEEFKLRPVRADKISKPGIINKQVIEHIAYSRVCVSDLSFGNPNAFYELGVRQAFKLSTIQIIRKGEKIPFDVAQGRTIIIDTSDPYTIMDHFEAARKELKEHISSSNKGATSDDNPISLYLPKLKVEIPK